MNAFSEKGFQPFFSNLNNPNLHNWYKSTERKKEKKSTEKPIRYIEQLMVMPIHSKFVSVFGQVQYGCHY
jgi:hypothetical protein